MHSVNKVDENIEKIGKLFPNCVTERMGENGEILLLLRAILKLLRESTVEYLANSGQYAEKGNRLVGIISHVAELKEKIDKQVVITKEKTGGSKIEISV